MDDFKNAGLGTFEEELQALVDYGHDCCARIDDKIHECCERINMLEREVKRLAAECKTQRNNFDQATSAREHWKNLYEQALEHTHDLERDYEVACHVNERQEREYLEWYNKACRMQKEIDDLKAKNGDMWLKGYHECHEELMEGNATLAADLERCGWMMPPKDSDGVPVRIGDVMAYEDNTKPMEVVALVPPAVFLTEDGPRYADMCRHYHEPTVEDVLRDVVTLCHNTWKEGSAFEFYDVDDVMESGNIAEYAATLGSCNCTNGERTNGTWSDFDMQMAYHMGYDDALARRKPDAGKVVTNG